MGAKGFLDSIDGNERTIKLSFGVCWEEYTFYLMTEWNDAMICGGLFMR